MQSKKTIPISQDNNVQVRLLQRQIQELDDQLRNARQSHPSSYLPPPPPQTHFYQQSERFNPIRQSLPAQITSFQQPPAVQSSLDHSIDLRSLGYVDPATRGAEAYADSRQSTGFNIQGTKRPDRATTLKGDQKLGLICASNHVFVT